MEGGAEGVLERGSAAASADLAVGVTNVGARAAGPTLYCSLEGALRVEGGEARHRKRSNVDSEGFFYGWEARMRRQTDAALVDFDDEAGMPSLAETGVQITLENVGEFGLGPAMEMLCRSRLMMPADVTIVSGRADPGCVLGGARH